MLFYTYVQTLALYSALFKYIISQLMLLAKSQFPYFVLPHRRIATQILNPLNTCCDDVESGIPLVSNELLEQLLESKDEEPLLEPTDELI